MVNRKLTQASGDRSMICNATFIRKSLSMRTSTWYVFCSYERIFIVRFCLHILNFSSQSLLPQSAQDRDVALSLIEVHEAKIDDLCLDFTLPGYPDIALKPGGADIPVTIHNVDAYIQHVL